MQWYMKVVQNYAVFQGRARRTEYWMFSLINVLIFIALALIELILQVGFLSFIYGLAVFIPTLAVTVRRLHDTGRSGVWMLIVLVPLVGWIIALVFMCLDSESDNRYGPNPKVPINPY